MEHEILYRPAFSLLKVNLSSGESLSAEAGSMVSMSPSIQMETSMKGGMFGALKRSVLGGESLFINTFNAQSGGEITLSPVLPGDIEMVNLENQTIYVQSTSYLASTPGIEVDTKWGGAKTFFSGEGLFLLKVSGTGKLFMSSYGAIHTKDLESGESYIVDTSHMVAFTEGVGYNVKRVGGLKSTLLSGEGLVVELTGPGKVLMQSKSTGAFLSWLIPRIPRRN